MPDSPDAPGTYEELAALTFEQRLEAFDDSFEEHTSYEEERVRRQSEPGWAEEVLAHRAKYKCAVKFPDAPPRPYPATPYSRKWEIEHDLLETKGCIKQARTSIELYRSGRANHQYEFGADCSLEQAIKNHEDSIAKAEEELEPLEHELAWLTSSTAFDFTRESYLSDPEAINDLSEEGEAVNFHVGVERGFRQSANQWFVLNKEQLVFGRKLDRAIYHAGDAVIPEYTRNDLIFGDGEADNVSNPCTRWVAEDVGGRSRGEVLAALQEVAKRDPTFMPRLRDIGPTPGLLREANHLLQGAAQQEGKVRKASAVSSRAMHFLSRARDRAARCSAPRTRGSRRVTSRSAGGGSSGADSSGEPEPGERPGHRPHLAVSARRHSRTGLLFLPEKGGSPNV